MIKVAIVDYGMGNIKSVQRGLEKVGASVNLTGDPEQYIHADCLVLPGVGAFENGMDGIKKAGMVEALGEFVQSGKPFLGICLGMQMLMEDSDEHGLHLGLGYIPGSVKRIPHQNEGSFVRKIPHIGWNNLRCASGGVPWEKSILRSVREKEFVYFVHSFMAVPVHNKHLLAQCDYEGLKVTAGVQKDNVTGLQFHPEKSGEAGLAILKEFVNQ